MYINLLCVYKYIYNCLNNLIMDIWINFKHLEKNSISKKTEIKTFHK